MPKKKTVRRPSRSRPAARGPKPPAPAAPPAPTDGPLPHHVGDAGFTEAVTEPVILSDSPTEKPPAAAFTIVGVGASAGGLEAFSQLLRALPPDPGLAIIFVQHLAPRHESMLATLLADTTNMPVVQATDGVEVQPNQVYVLPPNAQMTIADGRLRLSPRPEGRTQHSPIDLFFTSLADYAQSRAVGVVLSGTASDGSVGLREIKSVGGITFAQEPRSARYDGMPRSAAATGAVDLVLPPDAIARELAHIITHPLLARPGGAPTRDEHMQRIFFLLRNASGVDFTHYKQPTIQRRLHRRMVLHKLNTLDEYVKLLQKEPAELNALYQDLLIHVTRFFREPDSFEALSSRVFPQLAKHRAANSPLRVWVPGCATGEEAYSVAIALIEFLGDHAHSTPIQIFATDVSDAAVAQARTGVYPDSIAADVSPERLRRFFNKVDGTYRISKQVRDLCVFARQDLTRDPPFSKVDLILCRNVLIYLGPLLQKKLMGVFHYALKPAGFLVLGTSETIGAHVDLFALADKRHKIYTKKLAITRTHFDLPVEQPDGKIAAARAVAADARAGASVQNEANRFILSHYAPPGVIVDGEFQIIQFRGHTGPFLEPAPGDASLNVLKMARQGLLHDLRAALLEARKANTPIRREGLRIKYSGHVMDVNIEIVPMAVATGQHFLVLFEDVTGKQPAPAPPVKRAGKSRAPNPREQQLQRLQQELAASREYLQAIIQDLEAANEELQSANEEILSSNEELQSTNEELDTAKEELQSTNEELNTVNEELQGRNEELNRVNSDLMNLLSVVQIAIVMVGSDLRIRRFTPAAEKLLNLIPTDAGRPIGDIKPNLDVPHLEQLIGETVETVGAVEREVHDRQGRAYSMRIRPYKNAENRIDGAVVAFFDAIACPADESGAAGDRDGNGKGAR